MNTSTLRFTQFFLFLFRHIAAIGIGIAFALFVLFQGLITSALFDVLPGSIIPPSTIITSSQQPLQLSSYHSVMNLHKQKILNGMIYADTTIHNPFIQQTVERLDE